MKSKFIKSTELCQLLGISISTVNRWVNQKKLPKPKYVNQQRYWNRAEIEAWLEVGNEA